MPQRDIAYIGAIRVFLHLLRAEVYPCPPSSRNFLKCLGRGVLTKGPWVLADFAADYLGVGKLLDGSVKIVGDAWNEARLQAKEREKKEIAESTWSELSRKMKPEEMKAQVAALVRVSLEEAKQEATLAAQEIAANQTKEVRPWRTT